VIHLIGYVSDEERRWLYEHAESVLVPSPYEGFGFPVLEGFAAEVPVITVTQGGVAEVADTAAYMVDAASVPAFAEALERITSERQLKTTLIELGLQRLSDYSWSKTAKQTAAALVAAIGKSR
jgi:glycosyltransferase involved in cell wall biosynthesis